MGQVTISITKRIAFRDSTQEFSNVYTYRSLTPNPTGPIAEGMIDEVVTQEKLIHSTAVTFVYARLWSSGGTQEENQMIFEKLLTGAGSGTTNAAIDRERAYLIQWPAGDDSRGRPVYLRKWYHTCGAMGGVNPASDILSNTVGFSTTQRNSIAAAALPLTRIDSAIWGLTADSGRERSGDGNPIAHRYFEHHQLGDQWRG